MDELSVKEYAELKGCTERYVRKLIAAEKINAVTRLGTLGGGLSGLQYCIPVASMEPKLIAKWKRLQKMQKKDKEADQQVATESDVIAVTPINFESLTEEERKEIAFWKQTLGEWQAYRTGKKKAYADEEYVRFLRIQHPELSITQRTLQRKWKQYTEQGETALIDMRGKHGNHHKALSDFVFDIFEYYYLDESRKTLTKCIELTELQLKKHNPECLPLPSYETFARAVEAKIPVPVLKYFRLGEKAFRDQCAPYIGRTYEDLQSNDIWVCDNHTFDIFVNDGQHEKPVRVYLTGFLDVRSRKMVGWYVTMTPRSDATLYALRRGIEKFGVPKMVYSDNGREFLTHDIGGRGFRKSADTGQHEPPTIMQLLGIEFRTALVRNAKAKIIERAFRTVKECFSRMFDGYTGGTIAERPERLKKTGKYAENFTAFEEFAGYVDTYIEGYFNRQAHTGDGMGGKCSDQVYAENLYEQRIATPDELNLMMLRNSRMMTVQRNGVTLKFYDKALEFGCDELTMNHIGEKVYVRFNPDDLNEIRIYDEKDRFLMTAPLRTRLSYFASQEEISKHMKDTRTLEKMVKKYKKEKGIQADDELQLILEAAAENLDYGYELDPKVIIPIRFDDTVGSDQTKAVGGEEITVEEWNRGINNIKKFKQK